MAGYPPQQHYAAPPQPGPYGAPPPGYSMHHAGPHMHHGYPPPMPPPGPSAGGPYQSPYPPNAGPSGGPWSDQHFDHHPPPPGSMHGPPPPQQQPPPPPQQQLQPQPHQPPPPSQQQPQPPPNGPPSLMRQGFGGANGPPGSHSQPNSSNGPPGPPLSHGQPMQHQGQPPYGVMQSRDYPPPPRPGPSQGAPSMGGRGGHNSIPQQSQQKQQHQQSRQNIPPHSALPSTPKSSSSVKRGNASSASRDKERNANSGTGAGKAGSGQRRGQDKQSGGKGGASAAKAEAAKAEAAAAARAEANDEPIQESKKIRKRKEVVDRIHRVHWDTLENRDLLYNEMQHSLASTGSILLLSPALSRPYMLALHRLTLERDAQLRQIALLHAHQVESARTAYDQDRNKVEDEARSAKKAVRERLLAAVEDRRKRLREDKEGGEGTSDALLDSSSRAHATRKLRNKATGSRRGDGLEPEGSLSLSARGKSSTANGTSNGAGSLGLSFGGGGSGSDADGASTPKGGSNNGSVETAAHPFLSSLLELTGLAGSNGHITSLPPSNFDALTSGAASATLLHLGVGGGMGDSSYMANLRATLQNHGKGKKKTSNKTSAAANNGTTVNGVSAGIAQGGAANEGGVLNGDEEDEDGNSRTMAAAAAAAAVAAATMVNGTGRLRWDQGKSVGQLTSAKDIEIESDLINIRKVGNKRRRR